MMYGYFDTSYICSYILSKNKNETKIQRDNKDIAINTVYTNLYSKILLYYSCYFYRLIDRPLWQKSSVTMEKTYRNLT